MLFKLLLGSICLTAVYGQDCSWITSLDCSKYANEPVCGSNYVMYASRCEFAKIRCLDNTIVVLDTRACQNEASTTAAHGTNGPATMKTNTPIVTVPTTQAPINGPIIDLDIICLDMSHVICPQGGTRVCGTDGKFYANACEFDKVRCFHRELHLASSGCV